MNTPPRLRSRPKTPTAPRLGPLFSSPSPGRKRKAASSVSNYSTATISPPPSSPLAPRSVERKSTSKKRTSRAVSEEPVDVSSSSSEESDADGEEKAKEGGKSKEGGKDDEDDEIERILGQSRRRTLLNPGGFGLPTPAKTPSRKRKHIELEEIAGSARVLFAPSGASSSSATRSSSARRSLFNRTPRQGRSRLDLLGDDPGASDSISIFTDSNARIPKLDVDPNNPFITRPGGEGTSSRRKSNRKKAPPLGEDEKRTDGMVYVFRGKKIFKKFTEIDDPDEHVPGHLDDGSPEEISLDRSTIRPRLLFPPKKLELPREEEEEAETDIDDSAPGTQPAHSFEEAVATKKKQKEPPLKRDISRLTPDSEEESTGSQYNMFNKNPTTRRSIPGPSPDEARTRGSPAKDPRVKRSLEVEPKLTSPRKQRGKRARV